MASASGNGNNGSSGGNSSSTNSIEAKIVVLGGQGVGKTSIVHRFVNNTAPSTSTASTIGASFLTKRVTDIDSATVVRLQIWDTAGQERFRSISKLYYRGANAAILCYDITNQASFAEMAHWLHELKANLAPDTILHIVGTKADLVAEDPARRKVAFESCVAYAAEHLYNAAAATNTTANTSTANTPLPTPLMVPSSSSRRAADLPPLASPRSNRSSMGFWGLEVGWNLCHEVSASSGEGVEEVFRVITRRLVEQRAQRAALEARLAEEFGRGGASGDGADRGDGHHHHGHHGYGAGGEDYVYGHGSGAGEGSFRIGIGDKRRSWLGIPQFPVGGSSTSGQEGLGDAAAKRRGGPCCT